MTVLLLSIAFAATAAWYDATPTTNPITGPAVVVADPAHHRVLLVTGKDSSVGVYGHAHVWAWDGAAHRYTELATTGALPGREGAMYAIDTARGVLVAFGGIGDKPDHSGVGELGDTWELDLATLAWSDRSPASGSPSAREAGGMAFDAARGKTVLFGGVQFTTRFAETWEWDGAAWSQVTPIAAGDNVGQAIDCALVYSPSDAHVIQIGAQPFNGVVIARIARWDGGARKWIDVTRATSPWPSDRAGVAAALDTQSALVWIYGGEDADDRPLADAWTWDGASGMFAAPTVTGSPGPRRRASMAYDADRDELVLVGGADDNGGVIATTFVYGVPPASGGGDGGVEPDGALVDGVGGGGGGGCCDSGSEHGVASALLGCVVIASRRRRIRRR